MTHTTVKHTPEKKVCISLSENEYDGIKKYLFNQFGERATEQDVIKHVQNIVSGYINAPQNAESIYIGWKR
jgi:hypothetical protein